MPKSTASIREHLSSSPIFNNAVLALDHANKLVFIFSHLVLITYILHLTTKFLLFRLIFLIIIMSIRLCYIIAFKFD